MTPKRILTTILSALLAMLIAFQMVTLLSTDPRINNVSYIVQNFIGIIVVGGLLIAHLRGWQWSARATVLLTSLLITIGRAFDPPLQPPGGLLLLEVLLPVILSAILLPWFWTAAVFCLCILGIAGMSLAIGTPIAVMTQIGAMFNPGILSLLIVEAVGVTIASYLAQSGLRALERANEVLEERVAERTAQLVAANDQLRVAGQRMEAALQTAEEASRLKSQFLANMSHELRTPLNSIIGFVELMLRREHFPDAFRPYMERVIGNAEHLLGLINDILDLARIEAGRMKLSCKPVDLIPILRGVMSTAIGLTKDKGLTLELDCPDHLPLVQIDETRIRQVLLNLLSNGAKFTEQGRITMQANATDGGFVRIAVRDTGIGILPDQQALIFEEFRQVDGDLSREHQGTGLGLPISKRLVELHGGQIGLESTPGVGSTFWFTIPVAPEVDARPSAQIQSTQVTEQHSGPLIVVVDDDPNAQHILQDCLVRSGYQVVGVQDSRDAVDTIIRLQPTLVILDVQMPHIDGWQILSRLRGGLDTAQLPIIMYTIVDDATLGIALGANGYIVKPVRDHDILALVQQWSPRQSKILIIDDDSDARRIMRAIIESKSFCVIDAADGQEGLAAIQEEEPDLIILDLMMPGMDGFEVLDRIRRNPKCAGIPVIIVTARDLSPEEQRWINDRIALCLDKNQLSSSEFVTFVSQFTTGGTA